MCSPADSSPLSQALKPKVAATIIASNKRGIMSISSFPLGKAENIQAPTPAFETLDATHRRPEGLARRGLSLSTLTRCAPQRHPSSVMQDLTGANEV
jgi:hypothetical protein